MAYSSEQEAVCVIVGASHGGVNSAFALRKEGWTGRIILVDKDDALPYHRPPLSKAFLTSDDGINSILLKPESAYHNNNIELMLGVTVASIDRGRKTLLLDNGETLAYSKLILAVGASPIIPPIQGIDTTAAVLPLRTATDVHHIKAAVAPPQGKRAVVIGGGYIGLEAAASLTQMGVSVTVIEREDRVLARVTSPELSTFFEQLHRDNNVTIQTQKNVVSLGEVDGSPCVMCEDGEEYQADVVIIGVGIVVNIELAEEAGLDIENGIAVDAHARTSDPDIYAIGDCTFHHNPRYDRKVRLESVQNAIDQGKIAAAAIAGKPRNYDSIPWFWSDQYDVKLQIVGLSAGYDNIVTRTEGESSPPRLSVWYFRGEQLLSVDAVNQPKAYVIGTKLIKEGRPVNKETLANPSEELSLSNLAV
ncbi:NAD(P)/FAD-dependent oxidoreductase [Marinimicrobium sp. C2-29]|uniref:NAD(P)/FAD-dependent oxidoreductase n=1 Tax=Marinimicrobium sp. C2-29 TaxID=3139825 RepID=UPI00313924E7